MGALPDIGLDIEGEAKQQLYPGHGVLTGTLRRSIHAASPSHNFAADSAGSDLGGQAPAPEKVGDVLVIAIGSGLIYALAVHQGHHAFEGYHYLTLGVEKVQPRVDQHLARHKND